MRNEIRVLCRVCSNVRYLGKDEMVINQCNKCLSHTLVYTRVEEIIDSLGFNAIRLPDKDVTRIEMDQLLNMIN